MTQPGCLVLDLPSNKWMFPLQLRTSCVYKCCSFVLYSKINLSKCSTYENLLFSNEIDLINLAFKCFSIKDKYISSMWISAPPPPQFLSGTLYFKFLDGVGYGWGEDKINPNQQLVVKPYQVLAKVHASYISSLIIYT